MSWFSATEAPTPTLPPVDVEVALAVLCDVFAAPIFVVLTMQVDVPAGTAIDIQSGAGGGPATVEGSVVELPATGAEFALLPPQNATGNWVKVVQRLPVRLELKNPLSDPPLRAGMSVIVEIDTGYQRRMPDFTRAALNWARDLI